MSDETADVSKMSFEVAMAELETIVDRLEKGQATLEESIQLYERGETLRARCEYLLKDAEMRIEKIALDAQGKPVGLVPFEPAKAPPKP